MALANDFNKYFIEKGIKVHKNHKPTEQCPIDKYYLELDYGSNITSMNL